MEQFERFIITLQDVNFRSEPVIAALKAEFLATKGLTTLKRRALRFFLPLFVIFVCPLCLPEVFSFKLRPANFMICLG